MNKEKRFEIAFCRVLTAWFGFLVLNSSASRPTYISLAGSILSVKSSSASALGCILLRCSALMKHAMKCVNTSSCLSCSLWTSVWLPCEKKIIVLIDVQHWCHSEREGVLCYGAQDHYLNTIIKLTTEIMSVSLYIDSMEKTCSHKNLWTHWSWSAF